MYSDLCVYLMKFFRREIGVLQIWSDEPQSEKAIRENEKPLDSPPHKPKIPFPQRLAKPNLNFHLIIILKLNQMHNSLSERYS